MSWMIVPMSKGGRALEGGAGRNGSENRRERYLTVIRLGGQYVANTLPIRFLCGTVPHARESHEDTRLSPIMKYWLFPIWFAAIVRESRRSAWMYGSTSRFPLM